MLESQFWEKVRKAWAPGWMLRRIEDRSGNLGTFDTYYGRFERNGWLELKVAGPNAAFEPRRGQPAFAVDCHKAGIQSAWLVGSPNGLMRLIHPLSIGPDWRDHLLWSGPITDVMKIHEHMPLTVRKKSEGNDR